jgi:2-methylisocitrate lyase-like PEP mutase family enzyme
MSLQYKTFKNLHEINQLFVLPNAWNAASAVLLQQNGFKAIGTSSAAVAKSLGYEDGEQMPFTDYLFIINRMAASVNVPLTVDIEMGYGSTADEIYGNLCRLAESGVAGINIEDSQFNKSKRILQDAGSFAEKLAHVRKKLEAGHINLFINVRCDTYFLNIPNKQQETAVRAKLYETSGADGLFLPCIVEPEDIRSAVNATQLPINVMAIPGLPDLKTLSQLGVKRLSLGGFLFNKVYDNIADTCADLMTHNNVSVLF